MEVLLPGRFHDPAWGFGFQRVLFEQVASKERPPTVVITPSTRHVGVTKRDTHRPGFAEAVRAADEEGFPVFVRGAGGGATAAGPGTFGFSIVRPASGDEERNGIGARYDEAASLALAAFSRLSPSFGAEAEVGEVRDEFCPGDHSIRIGGWEEGMKVVGIAQRVTSRATSVGGIVLVSGEEDLARVLARVYSAMDLPFRVGSVGSLRRAGYDVSVEEVIRHFAAEAGVRYGAARVGLDAETLRLAREKGAEYLMKPV